MLRVALKMGRKYVNLTENAAVNLVTHIKKRKNAQK